MTRPGYVVWHSSEEDGGPDVGITVGLGDGKMLWVGERSGREGDGMGLLVYGDKSIDANASLGEYDEIRDLVEHHIAPALSRLASVSSASADTGCYQARFRDLITPEPVPATNQAGEVERARELAIKYALPGTYDGISSYATRQGDADDAPYMHALLAALATPERSTAQIDRIKEAVEQYRNAPFRSADWLAGELMTILDTEAANDRS
jgi:hypothetical protein